MKRLLQQAPHYWLWLGIAIVLAVLPHNRHTPLWIPAACIGLVCWKLISVYIRPPVPGAGGWLAKIISNLLALVLVAGVYLHYGSLLGRDAGVALLIVLGGFKFLESRRERDLYVTTALGFFLIVTNFFFSQTMGTAGYLLLVALCLITALLDLNDPRRRLAPQHKFRYAGIMLAQALPLMLIVFILFPRVPGPLWGIPEDAHAGTTGLDDIMTPGSISLLSDSDEISFRVKFAGDPPPRAEMYWRGPVLWDTDGRTWTTGQSRERGASEIIERGEGIGYQITLEPHNRNWIFALEMPVTIPAETHLSHDQQLLNDKRINKRRRFELTSHTDYRLVGGNAIDFERALALPPDQHPRTLALAHGWRARGLDSQAIIDKTMAMFHNQTFYYSLNPPLLTGDTVDQFLFETREGFCEHYAAAFTVLMRAAGIPARIVTGYQGGTWNPVGEYYIVRQHDAHAWTEVWLNGGWQRIDPTAAVSPARIREGIGTVLPEGAAQPLGVDRDSWAGRALENLRNSWDAINNQWNQWVLGYTQTRQRDLLHRIGIDYHDWRGLAVWLAGAIGAAILAIGLWVLNQQRNHTDAARRLYDRFCRKLARAGLQRRSYEGPRDYARRASQRFSAQAEAIQTITERYIEIRYRGQHRDLETLRLAVNRFRPRHSAWGH